MSIQRLGRSKLQPTISYKTPLWKIKIGFWKIGGVKDKKNIQGKDYVILTKLKYLTMNAKQNIILKGGAL